MKKLLIALNALMALGLLTAIFSDELGIHLSAKTSKDNFRGIASIDEIDEDEKAAIEVEIESLRERAEEADLADQDKLAARLEKSADDLEKLIEDEDEDKTKTELKRENRTLRRRYTSLKQDILFNNPGYGASLGLATSRNDLYGNDMYGYGQNAYSMQNRYSVQQDQQMQSQMMMAQLGQLMQANQVEHERQLQYSQNLINNLVGQLAQTNQQTLAFAQNFVGSNQQNINGIVNSFLSGQTANQNGQYALANNGYYDSNRYNSPYGLNGMLDFSPTAPTISTMPATQSGNFSLSR